jgi:capsule polysaccharide export protein KpsE/RkpR
MENNNEEYIDIRELVKKILAKKKVFFISLPITFIVACIIILPVPRTYTSETCMAPELGAAMSSGGSLADIASSFGVDLSNMQSTDAISPILYPDLMNDNEFVTSLFPIKVKTLDGEINSTYYEYLTKHQKSAWWSAPSKWLKKLMSSFASKEIPRGKGGFNPYALSRKDDEVCKGIRNNITINVDRKTSVISISVESQDPLVSKTIADSTRVLLQDYITKYRTSKARNDVNYYTKLTDEARASYVKARQLYGGYADANMDIILESYKAKQEDLENDMQLKYNNYSQMLAQLQLAKAKLQERTPAFTTIQGAAVPIKPTGPKRMLFVLGMLILVTLIDCFVILKKDLKSLIMPSK